MQNIKFINAANHQNYNIIINIMKIGMDAVSSRCSSISNQVNELQDQDMKGPLPTSKLPISYASNPQNFTIQMNRSSLTSGSNSLLLSKRMSTVQQQVQTKQSVLKPTRSIINNHSESIASSSIVGGGISVIKPQFFSQYFGNQFE